MFENETSYEGVVISAQVKAELETQAAAEFLRFSENPDGSFTMQAKLPEYGRVGGQDIRLRANLNRMMRAMSRRCFDEAGVFHAQTALTLAEELGQAFEEGQAGIPQVIRLLQIPEANAEEFSLFLRLFPGTARQTLLNQFQLQAQSLIDFQANLQLLPETEDEKLHFTRSRLITESYRDYKNTLLMFRRMQNSDPETEPRILFGMDCLGYARLNQALIPMTAAYRDAHGLSRLEARPGRLALTRATRPLNAALNEDRAFNEHYYTGVTATLGGVPKIISLEMTAPPAGKLLFCPVESRTGIGIYENADRIMQYHVGRNVVQIPDRPQTMDCYKPEIDPEHPVDAIVPPANFELAHGPLARYFAEKKQLEALIPPEELARQHTQNMLRARQAQEQADHIREQAAQRAAQNEVLRSDPFRLDRERLTTKAMLGIYAEQYREYADLDPVLGEILGLMEQYANLNVNAVRGDYAEEQRLAGELFQKVQTYYDELEQLQNPEEGNLPHQNYDPEDPQERARYLIASNLLFYLEGQQMGSLDIIREPGAIFVDGTAFPITNTDPATGEQDRFISAADQQLFPHDPCPDDIKQGALGNCYLLAALSSAAEQDPDALRRCMRDNGDGTVTVRFYQHSYNKETGESRGYAPVYVTVDKQVPETQGSSNALWVQMFERAYAASGLHLGNADFVQAVPSKAELEREFERISALPPEMRPCHEQCPWLISPTGELHRWQPDYHQIESGNSADFLQCLLGEKAACDFAQLKSVRNAKDLAIGDTGYYLIGRAYLDRAGDNATPAEKRAISESDGFSSQMISGMLFRMLFPDQPVPLTAAGDFKVNATPETQFAARSVSVLCGAMSMIPEHQGRDDLKAKQTAVLDGFRQLMEDPTRQPELPALASYQQVVSGMPQDHRQRMAALMPDLSAKLEDALDLAIPPEHYGGVYTNEMNRVYRALETNLGRGNLVTAATPGTSDRRVNEGIHQNHAYSVLGVHEKELGGKRLKFVTLRNPHGQMGREYFDDNGTIRFHAKPDAPGGVFDMEFEDFCREFEEVSTANMGRYAPKARIIREAAPGQSILTGDTLSSYSRAIGSIWSALDTTGRDSDQYTAFYGILKSVMEKRLVGKNMGKETAALAGEDRMIDLERAADAYLAYCAGNEKGGSRRANRVAQAKLVKSTISALRSGCRDPKDYYAEALADKLMTGHPEYQGLAPEAKREQVAHFTRSAVFRHLKDHMSFRQVFALSEKSASDVKKVWANMEKRLVKEELLSQPNAPAAGNRQRQPEARQPGGPARRS